MKPTTYVMAGLVVAGFLVSAAGIINEFECRKVEKPVAEFIGDPVDLSPGSFDRVVINPVDVMGLNGYYLSFDEFAGYVIEQSDSVDSPKVIMASDMVPYARLDVDSGVLDLTLDFSELSGGNGEYADDDGRRILLNVGMPQPITIVVPSGALRSVDSFSSLPLTLSGITSQSLGVAKSQGVIGMNGCRIDTLHYMATDDLPDLSLSFGDTDVSRFIVEGSPAGINLESKGNSRIGLMSWHSSELKGDDRINLPDSLVDEFVWTPGSDLRHLTLISSSRVVVKNE